MLRKMTVIVQLAVVLAGLLCGCDGGIYMGSKAVGVRSGEFVSSAGTVSAVYNVPMDRVWRAAGDLLTEMKASEVKRDRKIAQGTVSGLVSEEKITIRVEYREREMTGVSILVGLGGSRVAAQLLHEKIALKLMPPEG